MISAPALYAGADDPPRPADDFIITLGPQLGATPGDPAFFLPISVTFTQPTVRINLFLSYDPTVLTPTLLAPNIFVQSFTYDLSMPGKIKMALITDLSPPPIVPPIEGDTIVAWISFRVTTRYFGYDFLTHVNYFDDPVTPFGDNFIVLQNYDIIGPPTLVLLPGDILILLPLYGDINLNTFPWEIGDAVAFMNFFMGAPFNRQQYANADCNHDGVQASISDLVFMLRRISYDSLVARGPEQTFAKPVTRGTLENTELLLNSEQFCELVVDADCPIAGASFTFDLGSSGVIIDDISLDADVERMNLYYNITDNILKVAILDWTGQAAPFNSGRLFAIRYSGENSPVLVSSEFSDATGEAISASAQFICACDEIGGISGVSEPSLSCYPNPFNSVARIRLSLPVDGYYELDVYDILGRKIKTIFSEFRQAEIVYAAWDGADDLGNPVSSGTYFLRLRGDNGLHSIRMSFLK
jgi:hypothetical protein